MTTRTMWLDVPILVKCLRKRCLKAEHYLMIRTLPVTLRSFTDREAPAVLLTRREANRSMEMVPGRETASVRRLPDGWATPLTMPDGLPADPSDVVAPLRQRQEGTPWRDCPFSLDLRHLYRLKPDVYAEKDLVVVHMETDLEAKTHNEVASLSRDLVLIGGAIHRVRPAPSLMVVVRSGEIDRGRLRRPGMVTVNASLVDSPDDHSILSYQRFRPDRIEAATAYAARVSRVLRCAVQMKSWFVPDGYTGEDDDFGAYVASLRARFPRDAGPLIGCMSRPLIEDYLDLRDGAVGGLHDDGFLDRYVGFYLSVRANERSDAAASLLQAMQFDLMRIEVERPEYALFAESPSNAALATLDEESFLAGI